MQPQQVPAGVLKQVTYHAVEVGVQPLADGGRLLIITTPFEQLVFPMTADAAAGIGKALSAPSIVVPEPAAAPLL